MVRSSQFALFWRPYYNGVDFINSVKKDSHWTHFAPYTSAIRDNTIIVLRELEEVLIENSISAISLDDFVYTIERLSSTYYIRIEVVGRDG